MITKKAKYALMALEILARNQDNLMVIADIARLGHIPKKFLELILLELKKSYILDSKKGQGGGYFLRLSPQDIRIAEVIRALSGSMAPVACLQDGTVCEECEHHTPCMIRSLMGDVYEATNSVLMQETLQLLLERKNQMAGTEMFYI